MKYLFLVLILVLNSVAAFASNLSSPFLECTVGGAIGSGEHRLTFRDQQYILRANSGQALIHSFAQEGRGVFANVDISLRGEVTASIRSTSHEPILYTTAQVCSQALSGNDDLFSKTVFNGEENYLKFSCKPFHKPKNEEFSVLVFAEYPIHISDLASQVKERGIRYSYLAKGGRLLTITTTLDELMRLNPLQMTFFVDALPPIEFFPPLDKSRKFSDEELIVLIRSLEP